MSEDFRSGHKPWYVGWSNCNPLILAELRKLYPKPHFLPEDAEMPNTDFVFLGYEQGAVMHVGLSFVSRYYFMLIDILNHFRSTTYLG